MKPIRTQIRRFIRILNPIRYAARALRFLLNRWRLRDHEIDYILIPIQGAVPPLPEQRSWFQQRLFGEPPISLWEIDDAFHRIAADPRPKGVILQLRDPALSLADLQTLRGSIARLRAQGKRVIAYSQGFQLSDYLLASAADTIIMQPGGELATIGLFQQAYFFKDALASVGISLDVIAITPYKGVYDQFSRDSLSPEGRAQLDWLLDSRFDMIVNDIASSRGIDHLAVRHMIDTAPHLDVTALEKGYIDALLYEEGLPAYLETEHLRDWDEVRHRLILPDRQSRIVWNAPASANQPVPKADAPSSGKYIAVLPITGLMLPGEGGSPPIDLPIPIPFIGADRAGDVTVVQQVRALLKDERAAAVVLFIDSGGGAAIAAEAMTAALDELAKDRPLVAFMNGVAASGGYMVAAPARWIVAQPGTITGSIGVVTAKPITGDLESRLLIHSVTLMRGANADLFNTSVPFTDSQRAQMRASIEHAYRQFIEKVAHSRRMTPEAVDAVGGGRVWTGAQALEHGLVDQLGDLRAAIAKAREFANLPDSAPVMLFNSGHNDYIPPIAAPAANPAAGLRYLLDNARGILNARAQTIIPFIIK